MKPNGYVDAIIKLQVPSFQIGQTATVYFKDTAMYKSTCESANSEENMTIYKCFHDQGSLPVLHGGIRKPLLCGADLGWRGNDHIMHVLRDNIGQNISNENEQYSELSGYYWIWKNHLTSKIIGIEHYRRHFIKKNDSIDRGWDLLNAQDIIDTLEGADMILPVPESLVNTSVYDFYGICFGEQQAKDIVKHMGRYFAQSNKPNYLEAMYNYIADHTLYRANMLITRKKQFADYCEELFSLIDYLKSNMPITDDKGRIWGYIAELFPPIYCKSNNLTHRLADIGVDDYDLDMHKAYTYTTFDSKLEPFEKDPEEQIKMFREWVQVE